MRKLDTSQEGGSRAKTAKATQFRSTTNGLNVGAALQNTVRSNRGGLFDVQNHASPMRGTLFKSPSTNMPTYWHESVGPQFGH